MYRVRLPWAGRFSPTPERMLSIVGNDELAPIAAQVREKLARVLDHTVTA